ncbi:metallophosphoesterase [Acidobacteriota bacterium]
MGKSKIFRIYISLFILGFFFLFSGHAVGQEEKSEILAIAHGPYLQNITENSATIMWFTNKNCVSRVEYGTGENRRTFPQWGSLVQTAVSSSHGLIEANTKKHKIVISNLEPGKSYRYRVISKEILQFHPYEVFYGNTIVSDIFTFKTLNPLQESTSFYVLTDIHEDASRLETQFQSLFWDNIDMVFLDGDTLSHFEDEKQIFDGFLDTCVNNFAKDIPFILIRGNHETRGIMARELLDYVQPKDNRYYYSFNNGPAHFIVLDTGEDKSDSHSVYAGLADFDNYRDLQAEWLEVNAKSENFSRASFQIVICHIPPYTERSERIGYGEQYIKNAWGQILNDCGIDLLICGHTHRFTILQADDEHDYPIVIGAKDTTIKVQVSQNELTLEVLGLDGQIRESFSISSDALK